MKRIAFSLSLVITVVLAGCGDKPAETPPAPAPTKTTAAPGEKSPAVTATAEVQKAVTETATKAVAEVKQQAQAVVASLSQQLTESTKGSTDPLLKSISTDLGTRVQSLGASLASNETVKQQLNTGVQALLGNKDADAVGALSKLTTAKLTPEQTTMAKEVYNAAAALVTQRNFSSVAGMNSDVGQLVNAVWKGNYTQALPPLQKLYGQASLTPSQKDLLGATFDQYMPAGWKDAAGVAKQGADALKKIGF